MRSWGHRLYEFRDKPIKWKRKKRKGKEWEGEDSLDEEE